MHELEILRMVNRERKPSWGGRRPYSYEAFRQDLGFADQSTTSLSDSQISSLLNGAESALERRVLDILSSNGEAQIRTRQRIETSLDLIGLFRCGTRESVIALIRQTDNLQSGQGSRISAFKPGTDQAIDLAKEERTALDTLVKLFRPGPSH